MKTVICLTCGCSLVRLGISRENSVAYSHDGEDAMESCPVCTDKLED